MAQSGRLPRAAPAEGVSVFDALLIRSRIRKPYRMKITSAEFIKSAVKPDQYPKTGLPEVAFAGRSNVGK